MNDLKLYLLKMTEAGSRRSVLYEVNSAILVAAHSTIQARRLATEVVIDEPKDTWADPRWSTCRKVGDATPTVKLGVVLKDSNAS